VLVSPPVSAPVLVILLIGLQVKVGNFSAILSPAQVPAPTSPHASLAAR
jgi:hypothetical protein